MEQIAKATDKLKRVSSAAENMSALVDDVVKKARKSFKKTGDPSLDAKFLKESVGALRELYGLLSDCGEQAPVNDAIVIKFENQLGEWSE